MPENSLRSLFVVLLVAGAVCLHTAGVARGESRGYGKLRQSQKIMSALQSQDSKVRVLVTLEVPDEVSSASSFKSAKGIKKRRDEIHSRQTSVLSSLGISEFKAKHRYKNFASFSGETTMAGLNKLLDNPLVRSVELDKKQYPLLAQGISLINADIPRLSYNGQGVSIAISDTGIDYTHPMLGNGSFPNSKVIGGYDAGGAKTNLTDPDADPFPRGPNPDKAHGTNCAGIAGGDLGAVGDYIGGVAHGARIYALKISADDDNGAWDSDVIDAWDWCITHKDDDPANPILVISHSFGGGKYSTAASAESDAPAFASAADDVVAAGITVLAASGNDGYCDSLLAPAAFSSVISVGAVYDAPLGQIGFCIDTDSCGGESYPSCSTNWACFNGSTADMVTCYSNTASFLDVLAPSHEAYTTDMTGSDGYSTGDYESQFGGTSAACPYAAGAVACLQSAAKDTMGNYLTPSEIKAILVSSGDNITDSKVSITKPRVNLGQAILSFESPPQASDTNTTTAYDTPVTIALQAADEGLPNPPSSLDYVITSLASQGVLADLNGTEITVVPYTLADGGNEVVYTPKPGCGISAIFRFVADDGGASPDGGASNEATVTVDIVELAYAANMDNDPGWTFDDTKWEWGTPTGSGGAYGFPDPTSGHTGSNVVGYKLSGDYKKMNSTKWATTPAIDCTAKTNVMLSFYRWLNVESPSYDHAYIEVSNNGSTWNRIWENPSEITDSSWSLQSYDVSAFADDQPTVYVRWGMGTTDARWHYSGWNIDDVELLASDPSVLVGDFVQDCQVDSSDLTIMMNHWLDLCGDCEGTDLNTDGAVSLADFSLFAQHWLEGVLP